MVTVMVLESSIDMFGRLSLGLLSIGLDMNGIIRSCIKRFSVLSQAEIDVVTRGGGFFLGVITIL